MILLLTMRHYTLERYKTLLLTWIQANKDYQPRQNLLTGNVHCALFHVRKVPMQLAALFLIPLWMNLRETMLMHLNLSKDHSWHLNLQRPCLLLIKAPSEFPQLILVIMTIAIAQLILRVKIQLTFVIFVPLFILTANRRNLPVQIYQNLMIFDRDYHRGINMRKSSKTKYRLKYVVFHLRSQLVHRISWPRVRNGT